MGGDYRWASEMPRSRHGSTRGSRPALRPPRAVSITPRCEGGKIKGGVRHGAVGFGAALQLSDDGARIEGRVAKEGGGAGAVAPRALGLVGGAERVEQVLHHRPLRRRRRRLAALVARRRRPAIGLISGEDEAGTAGAGQGLGGDRVPAVPRALERPEPWRRRHP